jgi:triacylglycerol lipase
MAVLPSDPLALPGMQLAKFAYDVDETTLVQDLQSIGWTLQWGPADQGGDQVYIATNGTLWTVAIRGTDHSTDETLLKDAWQDMDVLVQKAWTFGSETAEAKIAGGTMTGLNNLIEVTANGQTADAYLASNLPGNATLLVAGHSLGGALTTVYALWLNGQLGGEMGSNAPTILPYTYASPTVGNQAFVDLYLGAFPTAKRYFCSLDLIPMAWNNMSGIIQMYPILGQAMPLILQGVVDGWRVDLEAAEVLERSFYVPTGTGVELTGAFIIARDLTFFGQMLGQHATDNYLLLIGAQVPT